MSASAAIRSRTRVGEHTAGWVADGALARPRKLSVPGLSRRLQTEFKAATIAVPEPRQRASHILRQMTKAVGGVVAVAGVGAGYSQPAQVVGVRDRHLIPAVGDLSQRMPDMQFQVLGALVNRPVAKPPPELVPWRVSSNVNPAGDSTGDKMAAPASRTLTAPAASAIVPPCQHDLDGQQRIPSCPILTFQGLHRVSKPAPIVTIRSMPQVARLVAAAGSYGFLARTMRK
jgi:hypothetical protein